MSGPSKLRHPVAAKHHASASPNWPCFRFDEQPRSATNPTSATSTRADVGPTVDRHCPSVSAQGPPVPIFAFFMQSSITLTLEKLTTIIASLSMLVCNYCKFDYLYGEIIVMLTLARSWTEHA